MLDGYIGQEDRLEALKATLTATEHGRPLPNMLFLGNSGLGKTKLATVVAEHIGKRFVVCHAPSILDRQDLAQKIIEAEGGILFIEEIHALNRHLAEDLYTVIDNNVIHIEEDVYQSGPLKVIFALTPSQLDPGTEWHGPDSYFVRQRGRKLGTQLTERRVSAITIIGATTDEAMLPPAFLRRLSSLKVYLRPYNEVELGTIATIHADSLGLTLDAEAAILLAQRARQTPARVKDLLERAADFAAPERRIEAQHAQQALDALGIDPLGLEEPHRAILRVLANGPLSRTGLGQRLSIPSANLSLYWGDLISQDLVKVTTRHEITQKGMAAIQ